jgi:hypothetical protein
VDKAALVESDIRDGYRLLQALRQANMPVKAAMWLRLENDVYYMYIVTPLVQKEGPIKTYSIIRDVLDRLPEKESLTFEDVMVANTINSFANDVSSFMRLGGSDIVRLSDIRVNDLLIKEAVVYEVGPVGPTRRTEGSRTESPPRHERSASPRDRALRKAHA